MDIVAGNKKKNLENLFSWSQFYQNSSLTVNRWPDELLKCKYNSKDWKLENYSPFDNVIRENRKKAEKVQQQITKLSPKK